MDLEYTLEHSALQLKNKPRTLSRVAVVFQKIMKTLYDTYFPNAEARRRGPNRNSPDSDILRNLEKMPKSTIYISEVSLEHNKVVKYRVHYSGEYKGELKTNIYRFKFRKQKDLGHYFGEHIYKNLPKDYDLSDYDYLLPVPSKPSSISERGYDAVGLIGERLSELCELPLAKDILEALDRLRQTRVSKVKREQHIKGGFRLINPSRVEGKSFLVLDDITTTGSTLDEVIRTLSSAAPRKLDVLVLAKRQE